MQANTCDFLEIELWIQLIVDRTGYEGPQPGWTKTIKAATNNFGDSPQRLKILLIHGGASIISFSPLVFL